MKNTTPCSCGEDTCAKENSNEPCWGNILPVEDYPGIVIHFCEGHIDSEFEGYKSEPNKITPNDQEDI